MRRAVGVAATLTVLALSTAACTSEGETKLPPCGPDSVNAYGYICGFVISGTEGTVRVGETSRSAEPDSQTSFEEGANEDVTFAEMTVKITKGEWLFTPDLIRDTSTDGADLGSALDDVDVPEPVRLSGDGSVTWRLRLSNPASGRTPKIVVMLKPGVRISSWSP